MKYHVNTFFGWVQFSEIVSPDETEEFSEDLKAFHELRLKWDDQEWFPKREVSRNETARLVPATR